MKNALIFFILCIPFSGTAQTLYPSGVNGCIARWTFDAGEGGGLPTIQDWSGNNNHGINNYITSVNGWNNLTNKSGKFNGTTSFAQVPNSPIFTTNQISIFALVKFDSFYNGTCQGNNIIYHGFDYGTALNWSMYVTDGAYDNNCAVFNPGYEKMQFVTPGYTNTAIPNNNYIDTAKWYLFVSTFNGFVISYYQIEMDINFKYTNITSSYTATCSNPIGADVYDVFMGATQNPPFKYWFNGKMDEVILFNRALTNAEVQSVYDYIYGSPSNLEDIEDEDQLAVSCFQRHLMVTSQQSRYVIQIADISGKIIKQYSGNGDSDLDLSGLPDQLLMVKIISGSHKVNTFKVLLTE